MGKILVVDADATFSRGLQDALTAESHAVEVLVEGHAALQALRSTRYDLVITDAVAPGQDGLSLILHLRRLEPRPAFIALSNGETFGAWDPLILASQLGAAAVFRQPCDLEDLLIAVRLTLRCTEPPPRPSAS